ncbi:AbrB/MazE/SpoVT family DNA-binding domain-containing protein [Rhizobium sp. CAU 1783]
MRVTSKGQVTIPRDLRELVGITPNSEVVFTIEDGRLIVSPKKEERESVERERLKAFLHSLDALQDTGDQAIDAEALMAMTRDR